nr:peptidase M22 [Clostridia bacterium]
MADKIIRVLGIDTSNYTTSVSVAENGEVVQNLKLPLPVKEGERGLRQSDAVFAHIKNLPELMTQVTPGFDAVGVSAYPRDCEGSYMPCFLAGETAAVTAASAMGVPLYRFSHQAGHIRAAVYSSGHNELTE